MEHKKNTTSTRIVWGSAIIADIVIWYIAIATANKLAPSFGEPLAAVTAAIFALLCSLILGIIATLAINLAESTRYRA